MIITAINGHTDSNEKSHDFYITPAVGFYDGPDPIPYPQDKKFYIDYDGKLRACKILRLQLSVNNSTYDHKGLYSAKSYNKIYHCLVAGVGEVAFYNLVGYASKEDFENGATCYILWKGKQTMLEIFQGINDFEIVPDGGSGYRLFRWRWDGVKAVKVPVCIEAFYWESGIWKAKFTIESNTYPTEEACIMDNEIHVAEFDGVPSSEE